LGSQQCDGFDADAGPFSIPGWTVRVDGDAGIPPIVGRVDEKACDLTPSVYLALEDGRQAQLERTLDAGLKEIFVRAFLFLPPGLVPSADLDLVHVQFGSVATRFGLRGGDGGLFVEIGDGGTVFAGRAPREQWFCFQASVEEVGNELQPGLVRVWSEGQLIKSVEGFTSDLTTDEAARRALQVIDVGLSSATAQPSAALWMDNVAIAESDVGCDPAPGP
jgi:hypothetical protein